MSLPPPDASSPASTELPMPGTDEGAPGSSGGLLTRRWALPAWAWLVLGLVVAAVVVGLVVTRPDDDSAQVTALQEAVAAKDAELVQAQADAQQQTFDDVQEVRDEVERQLSDAASAREQAEQASELVTQKYTDLIAFETARVQAEAVAQACSDADAAGYAQAPKPDPATFGPAAAAGLPDDASVRVLAGLDQTAIEAKVEECFQTGSERYLSQTTTTTTSAPIDLPIESGQLTSSATPS